MSLAARVVARYLAAENLVAEPGTTYVYQVDRNNQVLYPGEKVLVQVGEKLVHGEIILGNKMVTTESGAQLPSLAVKAEDGNVYDATEAGVVKLPQTIPTPRTVNASKVSREMKMYDYDRRASSFEFNVRLSQKLGVEGAAMALSSVSKAFVDGQQLGLISSIEVRVMAKESLPQVRVGVLEGLSRDGFSRSSASIQKSARRVVADLRRFPTVEVVCPDYLR
jgi:hypothetical protein